MFLSRETCPSDKIFSCHRNNMQLIQLFLFLNWTFVFATTLYFLFPGTSSFDSELILTRVRLILWPEFSSRDNKYFQWQICTNYERNILLCQETFYCNQKSLSIKGNILWHQDPIKIPPWWNSFILLFWNSKSVFNEFALT